MIGDYFFYPAYRNKTVHNGRNYPTAKEEPRTPPVGWTTVNVVKSEVNTLSSRFNRQTRGQYKNAAGGEHGRGVYPSPQKGVQQKTQYAIEPRNFGQGRRSAERLWYVREEGTIVAISGHVDSSGPGKKELQQLIKKSNGMDLNTTQKVAWTTKGEVEKEWFFVEEE